MREDLVQLSAEALVLLANRGLVKRAQKMLDRGEGPELEEADGVVVGRFADGPVVTWPPATSMADADCSCGSTGMCRHRVCVALAYEGDAPAEEASWSPGEFDDAAVEALIGGRSLGVARRRLRAGLDAEVHRGTQPRVHLPNGTVRFPVPHALEMVHCDAVGSEREVLIALAVWACREAEGLAGEAPVVQVHLVDATVDFDPAPFEGLDPWLRTALETGISNLPTPAAARLTRARSEVKAAGWVWVDDAIAALESQVEAYRARDARYAPERAAGLIGEIFARHRATRSPGPPSAGWFVGTGVAPETLLEHLTLTGLGARVRSVGDQVDVDVYLLDRRSGAVLVLSRSYPKEAEVPVGSRTAGSARLRLSALAAGQLTTQGAVRLANRQVRLAGERGVRKHDLKPGGGGWAAIDEPVRVVSAEGLQRELSERPPRAIRPRLRAEDLRILSLASVDHIGWMPGAGELVALATLAGEGGQAQLRLAHDGAAPGACGVLEAALMQEPTHVAGHVHLQGELVVVSVTAVALAGRVVVPALDAGQSVRSPSMGEPPADALAESLRSARAALADRAHHGLSGSTQGLDQVAARLGSLGMPKLALRLQAVGRAEDRCAAWADAWISVAVASER